ncbi:hypothetical protein ACQZ6F_11895 [Rhizobium sp. A22-96]
MSDQFMPDSVRYFERLVYASMVVTFCDYFISWTDTSEKFNESPILFMIVQVMVFGAQLFWVWLVVYQKLNWARWITLLAQFLMLLVVGYGIDKHFGGGTWTIVISSLQVIISLLATCFLFTRDATMWFVPQRA